MEKEQQINQLINKKAFEQAFNVVVDEYQQRLYWHIRRMVTDHDDANDVLQNTFIKIWKALPRFKGQSKFYTWAYRIATNESITFINKRKDDASFDEMAFGISQNLEADAFFDGDEAQRKLHAAVAALPEKQKAVFNLKYFEELKYDEISEIMETSVGALKASYHHAVKKIEEFLSND
ncbi:MAG: sigma-70 family RNA polymerase sigma factor [Schleiferiaceae bacterium]|jgi:RNA polymerase sigma-70 factor (ECF subfamily)|nr:sigma-70 family RNA polymerase sigma factor [Schleiferiaceae bacterium]